MKADGMEKKRSKLVPQFYRTLLILGVSAAVVAFIFFLLFINYHFAVDLRKTNLKNMKAETEKRAALVGFFFADRKDDLLNLALSREVSVFFENKALGMSMEYGLRFSLLPIQDRFQDLVNRKKLGSDTVYSRIMFIETNGNILVDTFTAAGRKISHKELLKLLVSNHRDGTILTLDNGREIVASLSYFFKNRYAGQIIAWIQPQTLYRNILGAEGSAGDICSLFINEGNTIQPVGSPFLLPISGLPDTKAITFGETFEFQNTKKKKQSWIGLKIPIENVPFYMLRLINAPHVVGKLNPPSLLTIMGLITFVLIAGAAFTFILHLRAKETIRESERRLSEIIDFLPDATFAIDREGKVITWNRAIEEMTGVRADAILGKGSYEYSVPFYGNQRPILIDLVFEKNEKAMNNYRFVEKKGDILFSEANVPLNSQNRVLSGKAGPLYDKMGNVVGAIESIRDMTEHRKIEEEKRNLQERLQRAEKMEALGTLAGGVAHDLNNVLGIVVGYTELLLASEADSSPIKPRLLNIMKGGERAAAIVQDLLTLARRGVPKREVLNLNKIIDDLQQTPEFENLSSYHPALKIETDVEQELLNISGSPIHISKTLFNLVSNASESMSNCGTVTIKTANQYLDKPVQGYDEVKEGDYVVLSVSDKGNGISPADLKRIFEPFYTKKVMGRSGTGLGLAVVWGTVKDHDGYINVESEERKGSTFTLYFPVTRDSISGEHIATAISQYMGKGESILVVDDIKEQRELAAEMLSKLNYKVASVDSGEEAVTYLKEHSIDLIVLDMIMEPGMDGLDTYRKVLEIYPRQKAIIVSGFSETDRVNAAQALGAGAYVRKPYVIEKMGLAVRKELEPSL
ncbi:MAG: ATP-binding protein [Smithella sp.]